MDSGEVVVHVVQSDCVNMVLNFLLMNEYLKTCFIDNKNSSLLG